MVTSEAEKVIEEAVARALSESDDSNHEDLCHCGLWPESCVTYGDRRPWSHDAESVARAAAFFVFETRGFMSDPSESSKRHLDEWRSARG